MAPETSGLPASACQFLRTPSSKRNPGRNTPSVA
ncbi:hypothetical protein D046_2293, partial [Vibrio parahaemolyticus V-223/04]